MAKFREFKATVPDTSRVMIDAEVGAAMSAIDTLIARIAEIPSGKTVVVNYVEQRSATPDQGTVPGFDRGGFLPGWGGGDRIPALLEAGEFVFNRFAVRLYGLDRLHAMNQMRLKPADVPRFAHGGLVNFIPRFKMPSIPHFGMGGVVRNLVIPTIPHMSFAGGGAVTPQVSEVIHLNLSMNGRPAASITAPRADVRGLVTALKELERGMR
ncbi:MAG: hypothetical protein HQL98_16200 [Magnetococcales bacterium]|nr:hypothetical protein [Magnetococcales bacterium]